MVIDIVLSNGKTIYLDKDTQIDWVQENMFFEEDVKLRGKYSYPFSIDRAANSDALDFADVVSSYGAISKKSCVVNISGIQFYKGQLNILDWTDEKINVAITRNTEEVDTTKYIDELNLASFTGAAAYTHRNTDNPKSFPEVKMAWPQFYNYNEEVLKKYGISGSGVPIAIINFNNGNSEQLFGTELAIPMFYLYSVIDEIFKSMGITFKSEIYSDTFFKKVVIYNPILPGDTLISNYEAYFMLVNTTRFDVGATFVLMNKLTFNPPIGALIEFDVIEYDGTGELVRTTVTYTVTSTDVSGGFSVLMPNIRDEVLTTVTGTTTISEDYTSTQPSFSIGFTSGNQIKFINKGTPVDIVDLFDTSLDFIDLFIDYSQTYTYSPAVEMKNHLPHITISTFLNALKTEFNLGIYLDEVNEVVKIYRRTDVVKNNEKQDLTQFLLQITEGGPNTIPNYKFTFNHDSDNDLLTVDLQSVATNAEAEIAPVTEISIEAGTLATENLRNSNTGFITQPKVNQELGDYANKVPFGLRFLFVNGYVADSNGQFLVSANNDGLLPNQIYHNQYEDWYDLIKKMRKAQTVYMDFGFDKVRSMGPGVWKLLNNDFLWKRITTPIHNTNGIQPSKVEGYKL